MAKYKSERLNALLGQPEQVVEVDEEVALRSGLLVKLDRREQKRLENDLAAQVLAALLVQARTEVGWSVRKVAERMHRHPSRVGVIEQGHRDLAFRTFVEYAHALGYDVEVRLVPGEAERPALYAMLPHTPRGLEHESR